MNLITHTLQLTDGTAHRFVFAAPYIRVRYMDGPLDGVTFQMEQPMPNRLMIPGEIHPPALDALGYYTRSDHLHDGCDYAFSWVPHPIATPTAA